MALGTGMVLAAALTACQQQDEVTEKVTKATGAYPARVEQPSPGFEVALTAIPLVADKRLRVLDAENRVWAEPLEAPRKTSAYWAYERDETLLKVVLAERAERPPLAVSLWADGALVAVDTRTGTVRWRARSGDAVGGRWSALGRYLYDEGGSNTDTRLRVVPGDGRPVVLVDTGSGLLAFDAADGGELWQESWKCDETAATTSSWVATHAVVVRESCEKGVRLLDARTGRRTADLAPEIPAAWPRIGEDGVQEPTLGEYACLRNVCDLLTFRLGGSTGGAKALYWWIDGDGRPVPLEEGQATPNAEDQPFGVDIADEGFTLVATDAAARTTAWRVKTPLDVGGSRSFNDVAVTSDAVWAGSTDWKGEGPALLGYDLKNGKQVACGRPAGTAITHMATAGDYIVVNDIALDPAMTAEPEIDGDDPPFLMMNPRRKSAC